MTLIPRLERTRQDTLEYFALGGSDLDRTYGPGKWSIRFLLHHLADSEAVFLDRIHRVLSEPRPVIAVMNQDAWAAGLEYDTRPLELSRRVYEAARASILYYAERYYLAKGHLEWVHSVTGVRTLKEEFDKVAAHNENHLQQIRAALRRA